VAASQENQQGYKGFAVENMSEFRVLEVVTPSRVGGAEIFVAELCSSFAELGAEVQLFCPSGRQFIEYATSKGISPISWKTHGKIDPVTVIRLASLLKRGRFDVIHTHLSTASLLGAFAARLAGKRSVAHVHGLNTATCYKFADKIIAVSETVKSHLVEQGIKANKIHVVHNGVDLMRFYPSDLYDAKAKLASANPDILPDSCDGPLLGVFGALVNSKGHRVAIESMFLILKDIPDARMVIVGEGKDREDLQRSTEALGLNEKVIFTGFEPDVRGIMSACDLVVVPSLRTEGFGLVAIEAMALGKPVIGSADGGLLETVIQNETGLLVPPNDPQAIATAACEILNDPDKAQLMSKKGREHVEKHFAQGEQMRKVLEVLKTA
jgi:glycosyltransferase involved in cell wall biosynthesis